MIGVLAGIVTVRTMASSTYVIVAGCFLIGYGAYTLFVRTPRLPELPPAFDTIIGLLSGLFGGMLAFPSVLVVIWTGCKGIDPQAQRAIYQPFILLMQIVAIAALMILAQTHPGSSHFVVTDLLYMPVALLGTSIGLGLFSRGHRKPVQGRGVGNADRLGHRAAVLIGKAVFGLYRPDRSTAT